MLAKIVTTALLLLNLLLQSVIAPQEKQQAQRSQVCEQVPGVANLLKLDCEKGA